MIPEEIKDLIHLTAEYLGGDYNETILGVPRIIYKRENISVSIVYSSSSKQWKVFYPFPAIEQKRKYFSTVEEIKEWLKSWD